METLEENGMVGDAMRDYETVSLRQELALRILLQNLLLIVTLILFSIFAIAMAMVPESAWSAAFAYSSVSLAAVLQWCHHGVRTKQIKTFLLLVDDRQDGWERWLPLNRPVSWLGSRWMISTKGVFLGLALAMLVLALMVSNEFLALPALISLLLLFVSAGFLLTNPKE